MVGESGHIYREPNVSTPTKAIKYQATPKKLEQVHLWRHIPSAIKSQPKNENATTIYKITKYDKRPQNTGNTHN